MNAYFIAVERALIQNLYFNYNLCINEESTEMCRVICQHPELGGERDLEM